MDTPDTLSSSISQPDAWTILDRPAAEGAPSPSSSSSVLSKVETFGPLTPPQKEVSGTATRDDEHRQPKEAAQSGTKKAVQVEDVKKEKTASTDVQHVWHKIMVADAFGLGIDTIINDIIEALTIEVPGSGNQQSAPSQVTVEADGSCAFSTFSRTGKTCIHYKVVDVPGTGDDFDVQKRIKAATDYIAEQNRIFYMKWTTYMRESPEDERVSCVLYFVNPHSIKPVDLEIMAAIGKVAPLVPVIAKGDSMSETEEQEFRQQVTLKLEDEGITTFSFPALTKELEKAFSVVSSDDDAAENTKRQVKVKRHTSPASGRIAFHRHHKGDRSLLRSMILEENITRLRKYKSQYFTDFVRSLEHSSEAPITGRLSAAVNTLGANSRAAVNSLVNAACVPGDGAESESDTEDEDEVAGAEKGRVQRRKEDHTKLALMVALLVLVGLNFMSIISPVRIGSCCKDLSFSEATAVSLRQALNEQMLHNDKLSKLLADETLEHRALRQAMEQKVNEMDDMSTRLAAYVRDNSRLVEDNSRLFQNVTTLQEKLRSREGMHVFEFLAMKDWVHNVKGLLGRNFTIPSY